MTAWPFGGATTRVPSGYLVSFVPAGKASLGVPSVGGVVGVGAGDGGVVVPPVPSVGGVVGTGCTATPSGAGTQFGPDTRPGFPSGVVHDGIKVAPGSAGAPPCLGTLVGGLVGTGVAVVPVPALPLPPVPVPATHARPFGVLVTFPPVFPPGSAQSEPAAPFGAAVAALLSPVGSQFRLP
jgi:hypothetical protein